MKRKIKIETVIEEMGEIEPYGVEPGTSKEVPYACFSLTRKEQRTLHGKRVRMTIEILDK